MRVRPKIAGWGPSTQSIRKDGRRDYEERVGSRNEAHGMPTPGVCPRRSSSHEVAGGPGGRPLAGPALAAIGVFLARAARFVADALLDPMPRPNVAPSERRPGRSPQVTRGLAITVRRLTW